MEPCQEMVMALIGMIVLGLGLWYTVFVKDHSVAPLKPPPASVSDCPQPILAYKDDRGCLHATLAEVRAANKEAKRKDIEAGIEEYFRAYASLRWSTSSSRDFLWWVRRHKTRIQQYYRELDELNNG